MSFTAMKIAEMAFSAVLEAGAGKLAEKFTEAAIEKMNALRVKILEKLKGRSQKVDEAIAQVDAGDGSALSTLAKNLDVAMDEDDGFAEVVQALAAEIQAGKRVSNSTMVMEVSGENATGYQTSNEVVNQGGENYTGAVTVNKNYYAGPPQQD